MVFCVTSPEEIFVFGFGFDGEFRITGTMLLPYRQVLDMILKEDTDVHASYLLHAYAKQDFIHILMSLISYANVCFRLKDTYGMFCERWVWMR